MALCEAFQRGGCSRANVNNRCPWGPTKVHQCALCLDQRHGSNQCPGSGTKGGEPKGKGKGKGRGKGGNKGKAKV